MAKYDGKTQRPVITDDIINIVQDAVGFYESRDCENWFGKGASPYDFKWVKIHTHRRAGISTAALKLLQMYSPSLIVTHSQPAANRLREEAINLDIVPEWCYDDFYHKEKAYNHIITCELLNDNKISHWLASNGPERRKYKLIIIDCASMVEQKRTIRMDELRHILFSISNILVELG